MKMTGDMKKDLELIDELNEKIRTSKRTDIIADLSKCKLKFLLHYGIVPLHARRMIKKKEGYSIESIY